MSMPIKKMLNAQVLIKPAPEKERHGNIIIPETASGRTRNIGKVVAVSNSGRDRFGNLFETEVEVGDTVMFNDYAKGVLEIEGEQFYQMHCSELIATVDPDEYDEALDYEEPETSF